MRLLVFFTLRVSALNPPLAATRRTTRLAAHRYFVVAAANASSAVATGQFPPNNLLEGRVDVLCRCATSALWYSNGIRADASLHLVLGDTTTASVTGTDVRSLAPDEKTFALQLQRALDEDNAADDAIDAGDVGVLDGVTLDAAVDTNLDFAQKSPRKIARREARKVRARPPFPAGFDIRRGDSLSALVRRLSTENQAAPRAADVVVLDEAGAPFEPRGGDTVVVVADQGGWAPGALEALVEAGARTCSLGPLPLLASQCITLINHRLDVRDETADESQRRTRRFKAQKRAERTFTTEDDALRDRLIDKGDPWDAADLNEAHRAFKASHNEVLARFARRYGGRVFVLDGADAASTRALADAGVPAEAVVIANPFPATAAALRRRGATVVEARAEDFLPTADVAFGAMYLDGCSGAPEPLIACAAYLESGDLPQAFALGFTLTLAEPRGREITDREQAVVRAWAAAARKRGYACRRPFDDMEEDPPPRSRDGVLTTWLVFNRS